MKPASNRPSTSAVILCIEIEQRMGPAGTEYNMTFSRAGQDSTYNRVWKTKGRLDLIQVTAMEQMAATAITQALQAWGGIQGVLET